MIVSSSQDPNSRSRILAKQCQATLETLAIDTKFVDLDELNIPNFDNNTIYESSQYKYLHAITKDAVGIVLCSPTYNWGTCSELKKYIEYVGSTDEQHVGALFDKVITFVNSAGLPHSYMAHTPLANSLMLDFKCIINPYNVYVHDRHWVNGMLSEERKPRLVKSMQVMHELCALLEGRTYKSEWEI
ncbi:NAD(P)H-dependent oxidoreductase [Reinekea marina]|uniref:NADPH-dependent FMN reductase n=1 Tax=Reinekea marina TaxID=1310421 RepID=UPI0025B30A69|nr:NAD(P)H-dependent oxidoreductase [Reinekea marina]MDN3650354.1 NAD(P)H-dependent oxidoreductase [Reinekea marina]